MEQASKESRIKTLITRLEFSALSWVISVVIHSLLIILLMFIVFNEHQASSPPAPEPFEVELGTLTAVDNANPAILPTQQQASSTPVTTVTTPIVTENIAVETVDDSEIVLPVQSIEQIENPVISNVFSESLAGGDTSGTAGFFGLTAGGTDFVYVIDRSSSMSGTKLTTAVDELCRSVNALRPEMSFYIIFYETDFISMDASSLVPATKANKARHLNWARSITPQGGTAPIEAILKAISLKPDSIWLLSDGQFDQSTVNIIKQANKKGIQIHTLAFGSNTGEAQLRAIAIQNGGKYRYIPLGAKF